MFGKILSDTEKRTLDPNALAARSASTEDKLRYGKQPATIGLLIEVIEAVTAALRERDAKIKALETKGAALRYCGTWKAGRDYSEGNFATENGSIWHANCATTSRPGTDASWTLAVKHGRDSR